MKIASFEIVTLHESGMRFVTEYEMICKDGAVEVTEYGTKYEDGERVRYPVSSASRSCEEVLKLLNDCNIGAWDGFHGKHPRGVLDGIMFSFRAVVNDGKEIKADGSENFPRHYRDFRDALYGILHSDNK